MLPAQLQECQHILQAVINARDNRRDVSPVFMALPDKKLFPDYYAVIPEPICLNLINTRLKKNQYKTPEDFLKDVDLVFLNAQFYNKEKSGIHKDSVMLEKLVFYIYRQLILKGTLPEVIDDALRTKMNAPRTKGRPAKNPLIDNYKSLNPDVAAVEPSKKPAASVLPSVPTGAPAILSSPSAPSTSAQKPSGGDQLVTSATSHPSVLEAAPVSSNKQTISPSVAPVPQKASHAGGASRLVAPPTPATYPEVVIPEKFPGLDDQDFAAITEHARIRAEADRMMAKWTGPVENIPADPKDEGNRIPGSGWWGDEHSGAMENWQQRAVHIVDKLRAYVDSDGSRPCATIEQVPMTSNIPFLSYKHPLSFQSIISNLMNGVYPTMKAFDFEMTRIFEKARRYYPRVTPSYGAVLTMQRMYNTLTSLHDSRELPPGVPPPSTVAFASLPAGPGNAKPMNDNGGIRDPREFTGFRVATKDRVFTNMAKYKGMAYKIGDYVHVANPDDPSRPIPAQIYRSFIPTNQAPRHIITVCWYFRPEQTVHQPTQLFYEDEVFKTGHMVDHPVEDIIERIGCQFYTKYIRGRPLKGEWYPGWPLCRFHGRQDSQWQAKEMSLDVCASRYNEKERLMVRIKNWGSCIPEELRKSDFMQVTQFDKSPHILLLIKSPFLRGVRPGTPGVCGFLSNDVGQTANEKRGAQDEALSENEEGGGEGGAQSASGGRPAKRPRTEEQSPLATESELVPPSSELRPRSAVPTPTLTSTSPLVSQPSPLQSATAQPAPIHTHLTGFTAAPADRPPPQASQSSFTGPHSIVPRNRNNPFTYPPSHQPPPGVQISHYPTGLQASRPLDPSAPVPVPPPPLGYVQGSTYSLNTQPIRPISNTQHQYNDHSSGQDQRRPQTIVHGHQQGGVPQQNQHIDPRSSSQSGAGSRARPGERTIASLYGSAYEMERLCETEVLPESTVNMLDRDPATNRVLWFSGPPIDIIVPAQPKHSAEYLAFLAKKRLQSSLADGETAGSDGILTMSEKNGIVNTGEKGAWDDVERDVKRLLMELE